MDTLGHGIDLVAVDRIARMLHEHGERFLQRCFTPREQLYAAESPRRHAERLAARFAAKEAVLKALGTGWRDGIAWTDIEVVKGPAGQPGIQLHGMAQQVAREHGITRWLISLSHTDSHASASAIALGSA